MMKEQLIHGVLQTVIYILCAYIVADKGILYTIYVLKKIIYRQKKENMHMIKGVSRYAVEIDKTDSPFFEKVICFVRPQYIEGNSIDLHREAVRLVNNLSSGVEEAQEGNHHVLKVPPQVKRSNVRKTTNKVKRKDINWLPMAISAGGGAIAALVINAIV